VVHQQTGNETLQLAAQNMKLYVLQKACCNIGLFILYTENSVYTIIRPEYRSRYSDWLRAGRPRGRSSSPGRVKNFLFSTSSRPVLWPIQPPIQWVPGALSPEVKRPGREVVHSPPTSVEVKKTWVYISTPCVPSWRSA
jgi:hypothetical protein